MSYHHLNTFERTRIEVLSKMGYSTRQIDDLAKRFRELDTQIQQLNWTHDLM